MATFKRLFKWQFSGENGRLRPCFADDPLLFARSALPRRNPMKLYFVLVAPPVRPTWALPPMKTMGFDAMRLVASRVHEEEEASWVAHGAQEVLTQAEAFDTLEEALADMDLVVATTARQRGRYQHYLTPAGSATRSRPSRRWTRSPSCLAARSLGSPTSSWPRSTSSAICRSGELPVPEPGAGDHAVRLRLSQLLDEPEASRKC